MDERTNIHASFEIQDSSSFYGVQARLESGIIFIVPFCQGLQTVNRIFKTEDVMPSQC